jgi:BirA family transcriptional regulator, biotin operon repressor / biotin---[acetyl-CoA-carboxylase] ligase
MDCAPDKQNHTLRTLFSSRGEIPWYYMEVISSTMDFASELVKNGCRSWTVVSALSQTEGRGTKGRSWSSLFGKGLWISIILPPPDDPEKMSGLTVETARVLSETIHSLTGADCEIKEPNDVLIRGRKTAGILIETIIKGKDVQSVILSMGVNISQTAQDFMKEGLPDATSLFLETGFAIDDETLLESFFERFRQAYEFMTGMK